MQKTILHTDNEFDDLSNTDRKKQRQAKLQAKVDAYFEWVKQKYNQVTHNSTIGKALAYSINQEKYLRVFKDIIVSNLIEPKIKKNELNNIDYTTLRDMAVEIFNSSFEKNSNDFSINKILQDYENEVFVNNKTN